MIRSIIIDDESFAIEGLKDYVNRTPLLKLIFTTSNALEGLTFVLNNSVDLVFLDINLGELSGIELSKIINTKAKIIFTTAYKDFAVDAFEQGVLDFLLKPYSYQRFLTAISRFPIAKTEEQKPQTLIEPDNDYYVIKFRDTTTKINISDIYHVEGLGSYLKIYTKDKTNPFMLIQTFTEISKFLKEPKFVRVHKSHLVSFSEIKKVEGNQLFLQGKDGLKTVSIGQTYKTGLMNLINQYT